MSEGVRTSRRGDLPALLRSLLATASCGLAGLWLAGAGGAFWGGLVGLSLAVVAWGRGRGLAWVADVWEVLLSFPGIALGALKTLARAIGA